MSRNRNASSYFSDASVAWERGNLERAHALFEAGAKLGDPSCQLNLGVFLEAGLGGKKSVPDAIAWYKRSFKRAPQGSAALNLADAYKKMNNRSRATFWFRRAVSQGDGDAALEFAEYLIALGRSADRRLTKDLLEQAISSSNSTPTTKVKAMELLSAHRKAGA